MLKIVSAVCCLANFCSLLSLLVRVVCMYACRFAMDVGRCRLPAGRVLHSVSFGIILAMSVSGCYVSDFQCVVCCGVKGGLLLSERPPFVF